MIDLIVSAIRCPQITTSTQLVLALAIARRCGDEGGRCFAMQSTLASDTRLHPKTVARTLAEFEAMDPPLISWNVIRGSTAHQIISQQGRFVVNILAHDQKSVAQQMTGPIENRFDGIACSASDDGLPLIDGALASFECDTQALIEAGDHDIILGRVSRFTHHEGPPLVYWKGCYASATPDA